MGKLSTKELLDEAFEEVSFNNQLFNTTVNKGSDEMIDQNEESIIVIEKDLNS